MKPTYKLIQWNNKRPQLLMFLLFLSFTSSTFLSAQPLFKPGYIILTEGDTLHGFIDNQKQLLTQHICSFKKSEIEEARSYLPAELRGYRFQESKYFVSKVFNGKAVFMEYLIKGKLNIYFLSESLRGRYFLEKEDVPLIEIPYTVELRTLKDKKYEHKSTHHFGILKYYTQDAENFEGKIENVKAPDHKRLISLAKDYHYAVCDDEVCIVYEKQTARIKFFLEPMLGAVKNLSTTNTSLEYGANVYIWIPGINERIFIKTGLISGSITEGRQYFKIPLQVQYIYPGKKWRPKAGIGSTMYSDDLYYTANFSNDLIRTLSLNTGMNYQINSQIGLSSTLNADFNPILNLLSKQRLRLLSYSFKVGLFFQMF